MIRLLIIIIFLAVSSPHAHAETPSSTIPAKAVLADKDAARPLRPAEGGRVDQVINATVLRLSDGRIIELAGIDIPDDSAVAARDALAALFEKDSQKDILLYQTPNTDKGRTNRMGHALVHVVRRADHAWAQGILIAEGLARAWPTPSNPELADRMFTLEDSAIAAKKGLWADDSPHRLHDAATMTMDREGLTVVQGTVKKVAMVNNVTYLNFGDDWKSDFTVALPAAIRRGFSQSGRDVFQLQNTEIRVRGWLRPYNGPFIELEHPVLLQQDLKHYETTE